MKDWFENFAQQYFNYSFHEDFDLISKAKVVFFKVYQNSISASIKYGNKTYNEINIEFKRFSDDERDYLIKLVDESPFNQLKIAYNTLPDDWLNTDIEILPKSLDDLKITCSGKYDVVEVLSVLRNFNLKLQENNFLIFELKGLYLTEKLTYPIKKIDDIFNINFKPKHDDINLSDLHKVNNTLLYDVKYKNRSLNFVYDDFFRYLISEVNKFPYEFTSNKKLVTYDGSQAIYIKSQEKKQQYIKDKWQVLDKYSFDIDGNYKLSNRSVDDLFNFLNEVAQVEFWDNPYLSFFSDILRLTYKLVTYNAIMPEIFVCRDDIAKIRWIPSFFDDNVYNLCKSYFDKCFDDLITYNGERISKKNQVIILVSLIMEGLINHVITKRKITSFENGINNTHFRIFTSQLDFNAGSNNKTVENISKKLMPFYFKNMNFNYALILNRDFEVEIKVKHDGVVEDLNKASLDELKYMNVIYDLFTQFKIKNNVYEKFKLSHREIITFASNILPVLDYINVEFISPYEIKESDANLILNIDLDEDEFTFQRLNESRWIVELCDTNLTIFEFYDLAEDGIVTTSDSIYVLPWRKYSSLNHAYYSVRAMYNSEILQVALLGEHPSFDFKVSDNFKKIINATNIYEVPDSLNATLRPYQKIGYSWLVQNIKTGFGSILADDMGLGKTIQVLTTILYLKEYNHLKSQTALIIVPPTLLSNWENEIKKFTPDLSYYIYHGSKRKFPEEKYDIILTSYSIIRRDLNKFNTQEWLLCVIDEAQNIKNPNSQQTKAIKEIPSFNRIALTGTPIENKLLDYWSIFDFVNKGYLFTMNDFKNAYVKPIEKDGDREVLSNLRTIAKPFVLRRLKSDDEIKSELPEKFVNDIYCTLSKKQEKLYNSIINEIFDDLPVERGIKRKGMILKTVTELKQICNHPSNYLKNDNPKITESGKLELLVNILSNIIDVDEKAIVFTQYVEMGYIIEELVSKKLKTEVLFLHGSLSKKEKTNILNKFQDKPDNRILVATLKTGGVGLNLTSASNVIHYDLWWNPAVENQATDRVHRIGQEKDVMVYRFITKGTLEEGIDEMSKRKIDLADKSISKDETFITELSNEELKEILSLRL